jgi:polyisoprenoid-binding protein YceI
MRQSLATICALATAVAPAFAGEVYVVDTTRSEAKFEVRYLYKRITGRMRDIHGAMVLDPANPGASSVNFSILVASVDTGSADLNQQLRSAYALNTAKFSKINFQSTSIKPTAKANHYQVSGELTLHGVTRSVTLPVEVHRIVQDAGGLVRAGFLVRTTVSRRDYGISWNSLLDHASSLVGDEVRLTVSLVATRPAPTPSN